MKILIVEDDTLLLQGLILAAQTEGYACDGVTTARMAEQSLEAGHYSLVVLDLGLPDEDGLHFLARIRQKKYTLPVLILTARDTLTDKIAGLDVGADDYLVKPFAFEELLARIRVMLRRQNVVRPQEEVYHLADLSVDCRKHEVTRGGQIIDLSSREFALLEYLIRNQGVVLSREQIEEHIWSYDYMGSSNMVDVYIRYLRRKIDEGQEKKLIQTVRGTGYVLREP